MGIFSRVIKESQFSFEAKEERLSEIKDYVKEVIDTIDFSPKEMNGILLAIEEACTNVIRHAYLYGQGTIRIKSVITSGKVVFEIIDNGRAATVVDISVISDWKFAINVFDVRLSK